MSDASILLILLGVVSIFIGIVGLLSTRFYPNEGCEIVSYMAVSLGGITLVTGMFMSMFWV